MPTTLVHRLAENLARRMLLFKVRRDRSLDILVDHGQDHVVFWPISRKAVAAAKEALAPYPKRWGGGYVVPRSDWKPVYDALHHGPCPIIGSLSPFGLIIDTP